MSENQQLANSNVDEERGFTRRVEQLIDRIRVRKQLHQIFLLCIINILYIIFESVNAFDINWVSAIIYGVISIGSIVFIWSQWESSKYLIPIPLVSLIIVSAINDFPLFNTILFSIECVFYFVMVFMKKNPQDTMITIISTGLILLLLITFMVFDQGFVKVGYEFNLACSLLIVWIAAASTVTILQRDKLGLIFTFSATTTIITSVAPFIRPEGSSSNLFTLFCLIGLFSSAVITLTLVLLLDELKISEFLGFVIIEQVGLIILSYSFNFAFDWLDSSGNTLLIDYALYVPLILFTVTTLSLKYYKKLRLEERQQKTDEDIISLIMYFSMIISSMAMFGWSAGNLNLIKALVVCFIFFGAAIALDLRISASISLLLSYVFLGLMLYFVANVIVDTIYTILMAFSGTLILFSIVNEKYLTGEPMTTAMTLSGTLVLMVCFMLRFDLLAIWISIGWAVIGGYLFAIGVFFEKIALRRTGLSVILIDIVYSIVFISLRAEEMYLLGIGFMVLAIVLFLCIYLFRWSEKRLKQQGAAELVEAVDVVETDS